MNSNYCKLREKIYISIIKKEDKKETEVKIKKENEEEKKIPSDKSEKVPKKNSLIDFFENFSESGLTIPKLKKPEKKKFEKTEENKKSKQMQNLLNFDSGTEKDNNDYNLFEINTENKKTDLSFSEDFKTSFNSPNIFDLNSFLEIDNQTNVVGFSCSKKTYTCKYCGELFKSGCAMGGHISKIHSGLSRKYKKKIFKTKFRKTEKERNKYFRDLFKY